MENIKQILTRDRYAKHSGIELVSVSPGQAVAQMLIQAHHLNALGSVQGGAIFTLADFAFAAASNAHGKAAVAINVSITYMKAASSGTLRAEARELSVNPKLGSYTVNVTDEHDNLIAVFQGLVYRKEQTLEATEGPRR
jgi:acyl-CoA thioesterase